MYNTHLLRTAYICVEKLVRFNPWSRQKFRIVFVHSCQAHPQLGLEPCRKHLSFHRAKRLVEIYSTILTIVIGKKKNIGQVHQKTLLNQGTLKGEVSLYG